MCIISRLLTVCSVHIFFVDTICYDDACHLKKFAQNPKRSQLTEVAKAIESKIIVCDRFHFRNHIDKWCIKNCNPYDCDELKVITKFNFNMNHTHVDLLTLKYIHCIRFGCFFRMLTQKRASNCFLGCRNFQPLLSK